MGQRKRLEATIPTLKKLRTERVATDSEGEKASGEFVAICKAASSAL